MQITCARVCVQVALSLCVGVCVCVHNYCATRMHYTLLARTHTHTTMTNKASLGMHRQIINSPISTSKTNNLLPTASFVATLSHLDLLSIISKLLHYVACSLALSLSPTFSLFRSTKQNLCRFICLIRLDYFFACQLFRTAKSYFFAKNKLFTRNRSELRQSKYEPELARLGSS